MMSVTDLIHFQCEPNPRWMMHDNSPVKLSKITVMVEYCVSLSVSNQRRLLAFLISLDTKIVCSDMGSTIPTREK